MKEVARTRVDYQKLYVETLEKYGSKPTSGDDANAYEIVSGLNEQERAVFDALSECVNDKRRYSKMLMSVYSLMADGAKPEVISSHFGRSSPYRQANYANGRLYATNVAQDYLAATHHDPLSAQNGHGVKTQSATMARLQARMSQ